jgi:predicted RNA binding protein YcfA (HicA-like mRNA interferase family)
VAKAAKELEKAKNNPRGWRSDDLAALYKKFGFTLRSGKGSHIVASHPDINKRFTFTSHSTELPEVYVKQAVAAIEELLALKGDEE